ncbi:MAG: hypothetical protein K2G93_00115 [Rikenella sp.]|nr:hypothetical protein [Rikenella sp.]
MHNVGLHGAGWSASATNTNAAYLRFMASVLTPHYEHYRSHGFQLRCLQE